MKIKSLCNIHCHNNTIIIMEHIWIYIFQFLNINELCNFIQINHHFNHIIKQNYIWINKCEPYNNINIKFNNCYEKCKNCVTLNNFINKYKINKSLFELFNLQKLDISINQIIYLPESFNKLNLITFIK